MITGFERILIWMSTLTAAIAFGLLITTIDKIEQQELQIIELTKAAHIQSDTTSVLTGILDIMVNDLINKPAETQPGILPKYKDTGELSLTSFDYM